MLEGNQQGGAQGDIGGDGDQGDLDRGRHILAREEAGGQHLDQDESRQPEGEGGERRSRRRGRVGIESAALEQDGDDRPGHHDQRRRRRQRKQQGELQRPVEARLAAGLVALAELARQ